MDFRLSQGLYEQLDLVRNGGEIDSGLRQNTLVGKEIKPIFEGLG